MAFRKRNVNLGPTRNVSQVAEPADPQLPGTKPSPLTSELVTSTGTPSLDGILGGHGGLALGNSLVIEENGTTDYAGALLRFYAAEGLCQGHHVHVVGVDDSWIRSLPGVVEAKGKADRDVIKTAAEEERMRIAWRYQNLGSTADRERQLPVQSISTTSESPFNHTFDLTKTLVIKQDARISCIAIRNKTRPFDAIITHLTQAIKSSTPGTIHRLAIPTILSPALWPATASRPDNFLRFLLSLRVLLRKHATALTVMMTVPLELYYRTSAIIRWAETLSDGVIELTPFPHLSDATSTSLDSTSTRGNEDKPQGMLHVHKLPITSERGEGGASVGNSIGDDLAFTVSRKKFSIAPFSLPPVEGDVEAQQDAGKVTAKDVEF